MGNSRIFASTFFILTSVTSDTSWGQSMSLRDIYEVSNFSWICQLSYEVLFVEFGWKLKHPETAFSQWAILDPPRLLNWPKSPHHLGLNSQNKRMINVEWNFSDFIYPIQMSYWCRQATEGTEFWIRLRKAGCLQLIQNLAPSVARRCQCDSPIASSCMLFVTKAGFL